LANPIDPVLHLADDALGVLRSLCDRRVVIAVRTIVAWEVPMPLFPAVAPRQEWA
jgi:hypothetical protein